MGLDRERISSHLSPPPGTSVRCADRLEPVEDYNNRPAAEMLYLDCRQIEEDGKTPDENYRQTISQEDLSNRNNGLKKSLPPEERCRL